MIWASFRIRSAARLLVNVLAKVSFLGVWLLGAKIGLRWFTVTALATSSSCLFRKRTSDRNMVVMMFDDNDFSHTFFLRGSRSLGIMVALRYPIFSCLYRSTRGVNTTIQGGSSVVFYFCITIVFHHGMEKNINSLVTAWVFS